MDWISVASLAGGTLGLLLALRLAAIPTENRVGAWTLAGFLVCVAFAILDSSCYRHGWFAQVPWFYGVANPFIAASGPMFYLYACATTDPAFRWRGTIWLHFIPSGLFLVTQVPLLFLPIEEKLRMAQEDLQPGGTLLERFASVGVFDLYLLTYFVLAWVRFWRRRERIIESQEEGRSHPLRGIGLFATLLVVLNLVSAILDFTPWMLTGMTIIALAIVIAIFAAFWFISNPAPLVETAQSRPASAPVDARALPTMTGASGGQLSPPAASDPTEASAGRELMPDEESLRLAAKLTSLMESEKPYLDASLSLHALAERLGTTRHRTTEAIKCGYHATFYQVLAGYRVREAARILQTAEGGQRTIADIAFSVGFNTLSAFNAAFRSEFAMTPKQYRDTPRPAADTAAPRDKPAR